ncbi:MAG: hypothetical protein QM689_07400 [Oscillospiraceae bacterium]
MSSQNNEKDLYEQQEERISAQSDAFIGLLTKRGILADLSIDDQKIRKAQKDKKRSTYHNTLMLLQHYRTILWVLECFPAEVAEELDQPLADLDTLLDRMDLELGLGNRKLDSRLEGIRKSRLLLDRMNEALTVLKKKPENGERLYQLIYQTYIAPEQLNHTELLYRLDMSSRHYYRLRQQAITILSIRLWAAPAAEVDFWLEMLTLLEGIG